ncbi:MAG TPA: polysaccharide export protein, partial [Nitrobacter sp.]|nr:polysaccharide export protein [Nitrobacter sp.]
MSTVRVFRISMIAGVTALVLSGCMRHPAPMASAAPGNNLDAMAYGYGRASAAYRPAPVIHDSAYRLDAG